MFPLEVQCFFSLRFSTLQIMLDWFRPSLGAMAVLLKHGWLSCSVCYCYTIETLLTLMPSTLLGAFRGFQCYQSRQRGMPICLGSLLSVFTVTSGDRTWHGKLWIFVTEETLLLISIVRRSVITGTVTHGVGGENRAHMSCGWGEILCTMLWFQLLESQVSQIK